MQSQFAPWTWYQTVPGCTQTWREGVAPGKLLGWEEGMINGKDASTIARGHIVLVDLPGFGSYPKTAQSWRVIGCSTSPGDGANSGCWLSACS